MTGKDDQGPPVSKSGHGPRAGTDDIPPRDKQSVAEPDHAGDDSSQVPELEPEPGTALDEATSTVTNTGPSS